MTLLSLLDLLCLPLAIELPSGISFYSLFIRMSLAYWIKSFMQFYCLSILDVLVMCLEKLDVQYVMFNEALGWVGKR